MSFQVSSLRDFAGLRNDKNVLLQHPYCSVLFSVLRRPACSLLANTAPCNREVLLYWIYLHLIRLLYLPVGSTASTCSVSSSYGVDIQTADRASLSRAELWNSLETSLEKGSHWETGREQVIRGVHLTICPWS